MFFLHLILFFSKSNQFCQGEKGSGKSISFLPAWLFFLKWFWVKKRFGKRKNRLKVVVPVRFFSLTLWPTTILFFFVLFWVLGWKPVFLIRFGCFFAVFGLFLGFISATPRLNQHLKELQLEGLSRADCQQHGCLADGLWYTPFWICFFNFFWNGRKQKKQLWKASYRPL